MLRLSRLVQIHAERALLRRVDKRLVQLPLCYAQVFGKDAHTQTHVHPSVILDTDCSSDMCSCLSFRTHSMLHDPTLMIFIILTRKLVLQVKSSWVRWKIAARCNCDFGNVTREPCKAPCPTICSQPTRKAFPQGASEMPPDARTSIVKQILVALQKMQQCSLVVPRSTNECSSLKRQGRLASFEQR